MLEILQLYVSGFWTWTGLTFGLGIIAQAVVQIVAALGRRK